MQKIKILLFLFLAVFAFQAKAQEPADTIFNPTVNHNATTPRKYTIRGIRVVGADNYEDYVLIGFSGLSVGQQISVPGDEVSNAIRRFWRQGLFSDVKVTLEKVYGNECWILIELKMRPRISAIEYDGVKKSEREDLDIQIGMAKGSQVTPNILDRAKKLIKRYYDDKGFKNADVEIYQEDDPEAGDNLVRLTVFVDKHEKVKIHALNITGLDTWDSIGVKWFPLKKDYMTYRKANRAMKKTNAASKWYNAFRAKKFVPENYKNDKKALLDKFYELGYRDARIISDSVIPYDDKHVDVNIHLSEGRKYYIRSISIVGNSVHSTEELMRYLQMQPGDVYNQTKLEKRINGDDDGIQTLYMDDGYLYFNMVPVEINVENDSVDLELRVSEGIQAHINRVTINGNDRLYEHVVRRELRVRPGELFSKSDLIRSARELAQTGHFDPEKMNPRPMPNDDGTVDIIFDLESKANDQVEFSLGWGSTGLIGRVSLKLTNISLMDLFHRDRYRGIIPQGEGEQLTISAQSNAKYYQSYSVSYVRPWFGGKRPNTLSFSAYFSRQSDINSNYYNSSYYNNYYNNYYGGYYGNYYGSGYGSNYYEYAIDPDKSIMLIGASLGFGKRLNWPDDFFTLQTSLKYQLYILNEWQYFPVQNGTSNSISLQAVVSRNSIDNPYFTRRGSSFTLELEATPPYSLFEDNDKLASQPKYSKDKLRWLEFYKVKFSTKTFTPLTSGNHTLVFHTRSDFGFLGHYNPNKVSPFESYYMGGDGNSYYSSSYITEYIPLRGYENGALTSSYSDVATTYARLVAELRYPFMLESSSTIYGLLFAEAGNAWTDIKYFNPFALKRSLGAGVRIFLPMIGMLGIDWGYGFDDCFGSSSKGGSNFHFVIGQEF